MTSRTDRESLRRELARATAGVAAAASEQIVQTAMALIDRAVEAERSRAVALCRQRAATWRNTLASTSENVTARDETRARANEATYLADLIEIDPEVLDQTSPTADA